MSDLISAIGRTPLLPLEELARHVGLPCKLLAKAECYNPGGSVKDRAALSMLNAAAREGFLREGGHIVEPTSGNTGVGLAWIAALRGYTLTLTMPESMSVERRKLLAAYGAKLVLTPAAQGMTGAVAKAKEIAAQTGAFLPDQFGNPNNPLAHERTTGPEIIEALGGRAPYAFVAGVGTGGTLMGVGRALRGRFPGVRLVAAEPAASPVLSGGKPGPHGIMGIGAGFVPDIVDRSMITAVERVSNEEAYEYARLLARKEGVLAGISSGAALATAVRVAAAAPKDALVVTLLPDTGERYLSTPLFEG